MGINIFWFSGTGNSRFIAELLALKLGECEVLPIIEELNKETIVTTDTNIIVYPDYAFGIPNIVKTFIEKAPVTQEQSVYSIVTLGGWAGGPHSIINKLLQKKGSALKGGWSIIMPGNYTPFYGAIPEARQEKQFAKADIRLKAVAEVIKEQGTHRLEDTILIGPLAGWINTKFLSKTFYKEDQKFNTLNSCTACGICVKVCPVNNIELKDGRPEWKGHCEQCFACLQWCPEEAIQYKKITIGRKRYHHPKYTVKDFFIEDQTISTISQ